MPIVNIFQPSHAAYSSRQAIDVRPLFKFPTKIVIRFQIRLFCISQTRYQPYVPNQTIPPSLWFKKCIQKPQVCELSRLCLETSTKSYFHEFSFRRLIWILDRGGKQNGKEKVLGWRIKIVSNDSICLLFLLWCILLVSLLEFLPVFISLAVSCCVFHSCVNTQ